MTATAAGLDAVNDLIAFIDASPSPFHACATAAVRLDRAGFVAVDEASPFPSDVDRGYVVRDGTLVAWAVPADGPPPSFRFIGAHTDSPNLRVKPRPDTGVAGARQLAVEVYGGALLNSWLDRDLGVSGRVSLRDGSVELFSVTRPIARVPQLAIHLDRDVITKGLTLNPQQHLVPVWGVGAPEPDGFRRFLAKEVGVPADDVVFWDAMLHDLTPSAVLGPDDGLLSAPRLDNLCSCWAAIGALQATSSVAFDQHAAVVVLYDHEEIGSTSNRGASSVIVEQVLERLVLARRGDREALDRALVQSVCVSADMAHATHPNYPDRHEPGHWIALNGGVVVKTNVSQRYATDARSAAAFITACDEAGVPVQQYVHRNDLPCGSTIGPLTASRLGVSTVDVGAPQLAMHSARELMGTADVAWYGKALTAFVA